MQVDLRPVERAVALVDRVVDPAPVERRAERALGEVPLLVRAELVVRSRRELEARLHPEQVVQVRGEVERGEDLLLDLFRRDEDVRVVLRHVLHPQEAVERPAPLVPVQCRRLRVPQRQLAVAAKRVSEQEHVAGAVHRLQPERPLLAVRQQEHLVLELLPVARRLPGLDVVHQRRLDLDVPAPEVLAPAEVLEHVPEDHPLGVPERRSRARGRRGGRGRARSRAGGGRGASPPRGARGTRPGRPASRTRCRRCASAACCARRRASRRRRGRSA